jgi:RNA polymerase sigma factor (sigma-70 family)
VVGTRHIEAVEDAVQTALMTALSSWVAGGPPAEPGAWLYRVAYNHLVGALRRGAGRLRILDRAADTSAEAGEEPAPPRFAGEVHDDLLRMLFVCCDETIPRESRLVLALKTLCGFSTAEIALRLFTSEANVHKRLGRARERLREAGPDTQTPPLETLRSRLPSVHEVLYLLFNEGYLSAQAGEAIRRELCEEAIRLATLLADHPVGAVPETFALLALMNLHAARLATRLDELGGLTPLEEQDRRLWDRERMKIGLEWLKRAASGDAFTRFHAEAGIAAEHCLAPSFAQTRWSEIADLYSMLERIAPTPLHTMNRAVAVAQWQGPHAGLALLRGLAPPAWLADFYLWNAVLGELHRRAGDHEAAQRYSERALASAPTEVERALLRRRLAALGPPRTDTSGPP